MANFKYGFEVMNKDFEALSSAKDPSVYSHLSAVLQDLDVLLRERMKKLTQEPLNKIIRKLKDGDDLSTEDIKQVEGWIIGDAESYSRMEKNFSKWGEELRRLGALINQYKSDEPDVPAILTLRTLIRDALKVLTDMLYFLQQQDRIQNFKESITKLTAEDKEVLVRLLEQKIKFLDHS